MLVEARSFDALGGDFDPQFDPLLKRIYLARASPSGLSRVAYIINSEIGGSSFASSALYIFAAPLPTLLMRCVRTLVDVGMYLRRCSLSICAITC